MGLSTCYIADTEGNLIEIDVAEKMAGDLEEF